MRLCSGSFLRVVFLAELLVHDAANEGSQPLRPQPDHAVLNPVGPIARCLLRFPQREDGVLGVRFGIRNEETTLHYGGGEVVHLKNRRKDVFYKL